MAKRKRSDQLKSFFKLLQTDRKGPHPRFPNQTIYCLEDDRVVAAIEERFARQAGIKEVRLLDYDFYTGLHNLVFEFAPGLGRLGDGEANALLVIVDSNCKVLVVLDPFDPVQPNKFVPPLPRKSEQPFILDRPAPSKYVAFGDEVLHPLQVRSRAFFERLRGGGSAIIPDPINWPHYTACTFQTWTPWYGTVTDVILDDCGSDILA